MATHVSRLTNNENDMANNDWTTYPKSASAPLLLPLLLPRLAEYDQTWGAAG